MGRGTGTYNPYTPDSGVRPPALTGRDAELARLGSIVSQLAAGGTERHVLITGLRGVGKTVLLNEFEVMCQEAGWFAETKEVGHNTSLATLVGRTARKALLQMSARKRAGDTLRRALVVSPVSSLPNRGFLLFAAKSLPTCSARMEVGDGTEGSGQTGGGERGGPLRA